MTAKLTLTCDGCWQPIHAGSEGFMALTERGGLARPREVSHFHNWKCLKTEVDTWPQRTDDVEEKGSWWPKRAGSPPERPGWTGAVPD